MTQPQGDKFLGRGMIVPTWAVVDQKGLGQIRLKQRFGGI